MWVHADEQSLLTADIEIGNMVPSYYVSMFECNLGIIFACGPALRQFWAYRSRTHTTLPTKHRQYPNEDFVKMRYRVNLRDVFWYRRAQMIGNKVFDATPIFGSNSPPPNASGDNPQSSTQVSNSILDVWENRIRKAFSTNRRSEVSNTPTVAGLCRLTYNRMLPISYLITALSARTRQLSYTLQLMRVRVPP